MASQPERRLLGVRPDDVERVAGREDLGGLEATLEGVDGRDEMARGGDEIPKGRLEVRHPDGAAERDRVPGQERVPGEQARWGDAPRTREGHGRAKIARAGGVEEVAREERSDGLLDVQPGAADEAREL